MSILLINPSYIASKGNIWKKINPSFPPLGLAYIASYLEKKEERVFVLDLQAQYMNPLQFQSYLKRINPNFIGITSTTVEIKNALNIAALSKETLPRTKIILGGIHPSIMPEETLSNDYVDFIVRGEGEFTFHELVSSSRQVPDILGLSYKEEGTIKHNASRPFIEDLNEMPLPAYHLLPMDRYRSSAGNYKRLPAMSMIATRGCPGRCAFCYTGIFGKKTRTRSAQNILEEIKLLQRNYQIKEISFYDDTFTAFKENVVELCERIARERINISWSCMSRVDFVDEELLRLMKRAGCHQIGYGLESASPEILRNIKKIIPIELMKKVVELTRKSGINVRVMFMLGNPGETEETLRQTIDFAIELKPDLAVFNITTPFPGTEMYDWAKKNGYLLDIEWGKFDLANPAMRLPTVSAEKIKHYYHIAYKRFYLRPSYIVKQPFKIRTLSALRDSIRILFSLLAF